MATTALNMVETISRSFPDAMRTEILKDINNAQMLFCRETGFLETTSSALTNVSTKIVFALPTDLNNLVGIRLYNAANEPLSMISLRIGHEIKDGNIYFHSLSGIPITAMPSPVSSVYLDYTKKPSAITATSSTFSIDDDYVDAVQCMVMRDYYAKFNVNVATQAGVFPGKDWNAVKYHDARVKEYILSAKKYINGRDKTTPVVKHYGMGGNFSPIQHVKQSP